MTAMDLAELNKPPTEPEKAELLSALAPAPELQLIARRLCFQIDKLTRVAEDLKQPNGIIGTPDGKRLFVADIGASKTYSYDIKEDGTLANKKLFCEMGSDGMTLDSEGNVYLTGKGVTVFDKTGSKIEHIEVPEPWTANVCIGGKDRQTLFITASKCLYSIRLRVKGANQGK